MARQLGDALGAVAFRLAPGERRKALASLAIAFPEKSESERRAVAPECFPPLGRCALDLACLSKAPASPHPWIRGPAPARHPLDRPLAPANAPAPAPPPPRASDLT